MSMIRTIAMSLVHELRERYPVDEIHAIPSFHYEIDGKKTINIGPKTEAVPSSYNIAVITGTPDCRIQVSPWSICVTDEYLSLSIHMDRPKHQVFDNIMGTEGTDLEGLTMSLVYSEDNKTFRFILAAPDSIEQVLAKIKEYYPAENQ